MKIQLADGRNCLHLIDKHNRLNLVSIGIDLLKIAINIEKATSLYLNTCFLKKFTFGSIQSRLSQFHGTTWYGPGFLIPAELEQDFFLFIGQNPASKIQNNLLLPHLGADIGNIVHFQIPLSFSGKAAPCRKCFSNWM